MKRNETKTMSTEAEHEKAVLVLVSFDTKRSIEMDLAELKKFGRSH